MNRFWENIKDLFFLSKYTHEQRKEKSEPKINNGGVSGVNIENLYYSVWPTTNAPIKAKNTPNNEDLNHEIEDYSLEHIDWNKEFKQALEDRLTRINNNKERAIDLPLKWEKQANSIFVNEKKDEEEIVQEQLILNSEEPTNNNVFSGLHFNKEMG